MFFIICYCCPLSRLQGPGAIFESECAKGNIRALQYRGMELLLISNPRTERTVEVPKRDICYLCLSSPLSLTREDLDWMLRQVLRSIVILFSPLSADSICRLLYATKEDVDQTLKDLHAILDIPKDQIQPLCLHHPSVCDFLINKDRWGDPNFWI